MNIWLFMGIYQFNYYFCFVRNSLAVIDSEICLLILVLIVQMPIVKFFTSRARRLILFDLVLGLDFYWKSGFCFHMRQQVSTLQVLDFVLINYWLLILSLYLLKIKMLLTLPFRTFTCLHLKVMALRKEVDSVFFSLQATNISGFITGL